MIRKEKLEALRLRMERLGIKQEDLVEKFILGSGKGGQKLQKTASCVYLKHLNSGIEIKNQKERGREQNRYHARVELCDRLEAKLSNFKSKKEKLIEKKKKQKKRRARRHKKVAETVEIVTEAEVVDNLEAKVGKEALGIAGNKEPKE